MKRTNKAAVQEMALIARQSGQPVAERFAGQSVLRFGTRSFYDNDSTVEHHVDITPEMIEEAQAIVDGAPETLLIETDGQFRRTPSQKLDIK